MSVQMLEKLAAYPEGIAEKWTIAQLKYHANQLGELLACTPDGLESSEVAYRVRMELTGL